MVVKQEKRDSPKTSVSVYDFRETLRFWKRREGRLVPEFVARAFGAVEQDFKRNVKIDASTSVSENCTSPPVRHFISGRSALLWWSMTLLLLFGLMLLLLSDRLMPNMFSPDCNCQSVFELLGWDGNEVTSDL